MRIFLVENTPLGNLDFLDTAPAQGDIVAYFREAQVIGDMKCKKLKERGVIVVNAEYLLDRDEELEIEDWVAEFLAGWWKDGEKDLTRTGDYSLGFLGAHLLMGHVQPGMVVRSGEIFRKLARRYPAPSLIITDIQDGMYPITRMPANAMQRRTLLAQIFDTTPIQDIAAETIPTFMKPSVAREGIGSIFRAWVGGFRPAFLLARLRLFLEKKKQPRIFFYLNHALDRVAVSTARQDGIKVYGEWQGLEGVRPFRYDHFLPIAPLSLIAKAVSLRKTVDANLSNSKVCHYKGFDYSDVLRASLRDYCGTPQLIAAIRASQARRFIRSLKPDLVALNADVPVAYRKIISMQPDYAYKVVNIEHGLNSTPYGNWTIGSNHPNMTVIVPGRAHEDMWGSAQPEDKKPEKVYLPNQVAAQVSPVRGRRRSFKGLKGGRVMILNYSPRWTQSNRRAKKMDRYTIDILEAAKGLLSQGVQVDLRPQLTLNTEYYLYMLRRMGLADQIGFDRTPDFADALLKYDVIVTNLTTCYYQALYAGWPTIFYEPEFDRRDFVGLIGNADIDPPYAETPENLVRLVESALQGEGRVATFPEEFNSNHLEHFLGPDPANAEVQLSGYLTNETISTFKARNPV